MRQHLAVLTHLFSAVMALVVCADTAAAGPLPRLAISLPSKLAAADAARIVRTCGARDVLIVLPATSARIGGTGEPAAQAGESEPRPGETPVPPGSYLHLQVEVADVSVTGRERETLIERQVADIVRDLALDRQPAAGLVIEPTVSTTSADILQFALATLMLKARGARPGLEIALVMPGRRDAASDRQDVGPPEVQRLLAYVDFVVFSDRVLAGTRAPDLDALTAGRPLTIRISAGGADDAKAGSVALLDLLMTPGAAAATTVWLELPGLSALRGLCATMQFLARSLDGGFEMTAPERASLAVLVDGRAAAPAVAFVGSRTADVAVLLKAGASHQGPRSLTVASATARSPQVTCFDATDSRVLDTRTVPGQPPGCQADTEYVLLHARVPTGDGRMFESVSVTARSGLRVEEIIARWQAAREAERQLLDHYSVPVFTSLHFDATSVAAGIDVALELTQFVDRTGVQDWVQTAFRVNGVKLKRGQEFPLPQVEPDKVVTRPLELRVDEKYLYDLLGTDTVRDRVCYVLSIKPGQATETLYSGKVWIDGVTFTQVRLRLEQRDGRNNVASHVETQEFEAVKDPQGRAFTLVRSIFAEDSVNLAGRSILVEKHYRYGDYAINAPDFAARLAEARAGDDPMFRDTEQGLRALRRKGDSAERVVEPMGGKRIWALLAGVMYTGAFSFPVPLAGASWVDFDFRKTGTQLSAFFAGPIFVANLSRQVNKDLRWGLDLSLIALPNLFYEYSGSTELSGRQVMNFEQYAGGLFNWQVTPELVLSTQGHLYWDYFRATSKTDPRYRIPASGVTLDLYGEAKYNRKSFSAIGTVEHGRRQGWRDFGFADGAPAPLYPNWTRYSIELGQHVFVGKLTRGGISAGYFGGSHLDRFSRYTPTFLNRPKLNGIPSGVDSFDEVTTLGAYYGFNVLDVAKLEGAYTHAWTRNRDEGNGLRQFDGIDLNIGMAGPFGTFVQGSVSLALRGNLERYRTRWGTYLIFLKPLKK
jgi:hypothetical protein